MKNKIIILCLIVSTLLASCVKEREGATSFKDIQPLAEILLSGKAFMGKANIIVNPTLNTPIEREVTVNIASVNPPDKDVTITLDILDEERAKINAGISNPDERFSAMIPSQYSFPQKTVTVKAGERWAKIKVQFYQDKIDPVKSWMLPIGIKSTSDTSLLISGNNAVVLFHVIGNPIAGVYNWDFTRWNNNTGTGTPTSASFTGEHTVFIPVSPTTIEVPSGYFIQPRYTLSFTNTSGVLSNFKLKINDADLKALTDQAIEIKDGPTILIADPITKHFKFQYIVFNGAAYRFLIDEFYL